MQAGFKSVMNYKLIYVFSINDDAHQGLLKVGEASISTDQPIDRLAPNCRDLNQAAHARIKSYTNTAGVEYTLLHTELAVRSVTGPDGTTLLEGFGDSQVHAVLEHSSINNVKIGTTTGDEWYPIDLGTAKQAITAYKNNRKNLSGSPAGPERLPIILRAEQREAIERTVKRFKKHDRYLWNAKMRFGKTLSALEVVKRCGFSKTIIVTHRPVVDAGWYEDFNKIFDMEDGYIYGSRDRWPLDELLASGLKFVYFASIQDLRGSKRVDGAHSKNDLVFDTVWDLVIVDEAHEGTTTALGDKTLNAVVKTGGSTKLLALSGTPFNIISDYSDEEVFTWDYVMEQEAKSEWDKLHFGDHNPYSDLPELRIYTYSLGDLVRNKGYITFEDKAFNFREFFRTWEGDVAVDHDAMPASAKVGDFVHEKDVQSFLNLLSSESSTSAYPFSTPEYRDLFRHTFWLVPGVREALALQRLMEDHSVFGGNAFRIINVAGDGKPEDPNEEALEAVKNGIEAAGEDGYTITLSCGKLTTGVTVKEWTGVFMLAGSYSTSASNYLQTIFRVQSPCSKFGKVKETCYVFDFAPDRTLKMVSRAAAISSKAGKTTQGDRQILGKFLNYCPVIAVSGSEMEEYNATKLLQQLKQAYAERVVRNGFEDASLYSDELLKLNDLDVKAFENLKKVVGSNKAQGNQDSFVLNNQGLTEEEYEAVERAKKKPPKQRTPEEEALLAEKKKAQEQRRNAISILSQISVRMPLLIYGADCDCDKEITLDDFVDMVDPSSWEEFMPKGVTKELFNKFKRFYDEEVFIAAGRHIRQQALYADTLPPAERVQKIASLFSCFKNPDKETVLTPWRVVNMHLSNCIGGWCFWDESFESPIDSPRFVDRGEVTERVFGDPDGRVLEINSKTGLYPLYIAYSLFRERLEVMPEADRTLEAQRELWNKVVADNLFVICKTPMAKTITQRTLCGYSEAKINAHYFEDLAGMLQNKPQHFIDKVLKESYWKKGNGKMKFSAVVGNPPYQKSSNDTRATSRDMPIYNHFVEQAISLSPQYVSMIIPSKWMATGLGLKDFRSNMLSDTHLMKLIDYPNSNDVFPAPVDIKGGVCYFIWDKGFEGLCDVTTIRNNDSCGPHPRVLDEFDIFVRDYRALGILKKVLAKEEPSMTDILSVDKEFGWTSNFDGYHADERPEDVPIYYNSKGKRLIGWINRAEVVKSAHLVDTWKVLVPQAGSDGGKKIPDVVLGSPMLAPSPSVCTQTYLFFYANSEEETLGIESYIKTKFFRFLVSLRKITQHATRSTYTWVPRQDFSKLWTDKELYAKYGLSDEEIAYIDKMIKPME